MNQKPNIEETDNTREVEEIVQQFLNKFAVWNNQYVWAEPDGVQSKCTPYDVANWLNTTLHHQLQKARHDWLRSEIEKLKGMEDSGMHLTGCPISHIHLEVSSCTCGIYNRGYNQALQTIIDRYQAELDQDHTTLTQNSNREGVWDNT